MLNVGRSGWEVSQRAAAALSRHVGGWASQPAIAAYLAGQPNPGPLPIGRVGQRLVELVERVRGGGRPASEDLLPLGRLLAVDYLLLIKARRHGVGARLFSIQAGRFAPQGFEGQLGQLELYLRAQTGARKAPAARRDKRWWIWAAAAAAAVAVVAISVAASSDDRQGDLTIRIERK